MNFECVVEIWSTDSGEVHWSVIQDAGPGPEILAHGTCETREQASQFVKEAILQVI